MDSSDDESSSPEEMHVDDPVRDAISTINDGNGADIDAIYEFVKARHDLMPNYRAVLEVELNKRVSRNELEMVDNLYKIANVVSSETNTETDSEPLSVAGSANTASKTPTSSGETHDDDMILDAIKELNDGNGAEIDEIYRYVKGTSHIDPDDRKALEDDLNDLVRRSTLEMVGNLYRYIDVSSENTHETSEPDTETESEPVPVADPATTSSDAATSSGNTDLKEMVFKALKTLNDGNGADHDEICGYIKEGYDREMVKEYLDIFVSDNELEMVDNSRYRIVHVTSSSDYILPYGDMPEAMVIEAISTMDYGIGVDIDEIYEYIENRYKIPPNYMKILEDELKRRVSEKELEKVQYGYKILDTSSENMLEAQSKAAAVSDQSVRSKSPPSDAATSSRNTPHDIIMEAVTTINDGNGVDIDEIHQFLEEKYVLSPNYRKLLEERLKRRVLQYKLEKVGTQYKILDLTPEKQEELKKAAVKAVGVSNRKELEAKEASEAADRAQKVLEENELVLQMAKEALARCTRGE